MTDKDTRRLLIDCYACRRHVSLLKTFDGQPTLTLACPFCHAPLAVDLAPYMPPVRQTFAGDAPPFTLRALLLPDVLPSRPPTEDDAP